MVYSSALAPRCNDVVDSDTAKRLSVLESLSSKSLELERQKRVDSGFSMRHRCVIGQRTRANGL